ncbi:MAG: type VI secretion system tip protein TssI/VgrG, partial [Polyangiaceae bacterium]
PVADDHGAARTALVVGQRQVERRVAAKRTVARRCRLLTTAHDLAPGVVFHLCDHPRDELAEGEGLLVVQSEISGEALGEWAHRIDAMFADQAYHPPLRTEKPVTRGLESATVVGPDDDEIHTDEWARVRVQFHWDREGNRDTYSSCWIPVSQPWGGSGFGAINIPRVGQEVLVDFLGADPDRPVVVGRVFTKTNPVPYKLPEHKTVSGIRSRSANRMVMGASDEAAGAATGPAPSLDSLAAHVPEGFGLGPTEMNAALQGRLFGALSPNSETHRWPGSEITMDDRFGREVLYMQAERDMNTVVKNSQSTIVGNRRSTKVGGDDVLDVDHQQFIRTGSDRCVKVEATQTHVVTGDVVQQSVTGNQHFLAKELFTTASKNQVHVASETIVFNVGDSTLLMKPDFVILQTPSLFLNPGRDALTTSLESGQAPLKPEEEAELAKANAVAEFNGYMDEKLASGEIEASPLYSDLFAHGQQAPQVPGADSDDLVRQWAENKRREFYPTYLESKGMRADTAWERFNPVGFAPRSPLGPYVPR